MISKEGLRHSPAPFPLVVQEQDFLVYRLWPKWPAGMPWAIPRGSNNCEAYLQIHPNRGVSAGKAASLTGWPQAPLINGAFSLPLLLCRLPAIVNNTCRAYNKANMPPPEEV